MLIVRPLEWEKSTICIAGTQEGESGLWCNNYIIVQMSYDSLFVLHLYLVRMVSVLCLQHQHQHLKTATFSFIFDHSCSLCLSPPCGQMDVLHLIRVFERVTHIKKLRNSINILHNKTLHLKQCVNVVF